MSSTRLSYPSSCARPSRLSGFTLVELVVVVAIVGILVGLAAPALGSAIRSTRLTTATNDFHSTLLLARGEAVKRNRRVTLCKSSNGAACASSGGWEQGWLVFVDTNEDGSRGSGEEILAVAQALSPELRLQGNLTVANYVAYTPTGGAKLAGGGFQAGTLTLCNFNGDRTEARQVIVNAAGRPRVQKTTVQDCV